MAELTLEERLQKATRGYWLSREMKTWLLEEFRSVAEAAEAPLRQQINHDKGWIEVAVESNKAIDSYLRELEPDLEEHYGMPVDGIRKVLKGQLAAAGDQLVEMAETLTEARAEHDRLRERIDEADSRDASLADALNTCLREAGLGHHQVESWTSDMRPAVQELHYKLTSFRTERDVLRERVEELEKELATARFTADDVTLRLQQSIAELERDKEQIVRNMQDRVDALQRTGGRDCDLIADALEEEIASIDAARALDESGEE